MSPQETKQVEERPFEELYELDVRVTVVAATTTNANTASCNQCASAECAERGAI